MHKGKEPTTLYLMNFSNLFPRQTYLLAAAFVASLLAGCATETPPPPPAPPGVDDFVGSWNIRLTDVEDTYARSIRGDPANKEPSSARTADVGSRLFIHLVASYDSQDEALRRFIQAYLASVASVDELIGEILDGPRNGLWLLGTRRVGKTSLLKQLEHIEFKHELLSQSMVVGVPKMREGA